MTIRAFVIALGILFLAPTDVIRAQRFAQDQPDVSGDSDGRHAWMTAVYRDLIVRKLTNPAKGTVSIDLRHRLDAVTISAHADGSVTIRRAKRTGVVDSAESLGASHALLADSEAVQELLDAERAMSVRSVPEAALLSTIAFVRALAGETESPEESMGPALTSRAWMRSVKRNRCAQAYVATNSALLENVHTCLSDGESWNSLLGCRSQWFVETEASWFDFLTCSWPVMQGGVSLLPASFGCSAHLRWAIASGRASFDNVSKRNCARWFARGRLLRDQPDAPGSSHGIRAVRDRIERVAATDFTVLIEGASGPQPHPGFIEVCCPVCPRSKREGDGASAGGGRGVRG